MMSLHDPNERGWCHNLLKDGVVGTLGPVFEPYLQSFPPADEFFPLADDRQIAVGGGLLENNAVDELDAVLRGRSAVYAV